jgi:hypothetical protein
MAIEKTENSVYIVYKQLFNENKHTIGYAIENNDTELLEYLFDTYHYTFLDFKNVMENVINYSNLLLLKCAVTYCVQQYGETCM